MDHKNLHNFYQDHLFNFIIPFWMRFGIDHEKGGFFTCFNNSGNTLLSKNKYVWSQGRFLWMLSRLCYDFEKYIDSNTVETYRDAAKRGAAFLKEHAVLPNGVCAWVLDESGTPIIADEERGEYDLGIAADAFLIYGMGEFARAFHDIRYFDFALSLFNSYYERLASGEYKSAPHIVPAGYADHGRHMLLLETAQELWDIARFFRHPSADKLKGIAKDSMYETLNVFMKEDKETLLELVRKDNRPPDYSEMLSSYILPGHAIEDAWFIMHFAMRTSDRYALKKGMEIVRWMIKRGWDTDYGGLPQMIHMDGGIPRGIIREENLNDHMIKELTENWDNKIWWVHSETLYALILAYENSKDPWFWDTYVKFHEYTFKTFPNPNKEIGEWIQIRDRKGKPEEKVVALPVKDPYHITRACMLILKSLERIIESEKENKT